MGLGDYTQVTKVIKHVIEEQRNTPRKTERRANTGQDEPEQNTRVNELNQTVQQNHNRNGLRDCNILWFMLKPFHLLSIMMLMTENEWM